MGFAPRLLMLLPVRGSLPMVGRHGQLSLPRFHRSWRRLRAAWTLQGEERPRRLDVRRLHGHHDQVAAFMVKPETIEQGLAVLNGECFCGAEGHTAECPDLVASLAEPAMQVLSAVLMETTPELCQDIVGVC